MTPDAQNPYQSPRSEISAPGSGGALASPWIRLGAAIIDGLVLFPINWMMQKIFIKMPDQNEIVNAMKSGNFNVESLVPGKGSLLLVSVLGIAVFIAVNFVFLKNGQTLGKKLLKLQIQRRGNDSTVLPLQEILLKRLLPISAVSVLAILVHPILNLALLVDALCIFRPERNTIHDDIAGSKVVQLQT